MAAASIAIALAIPAGSAELSPVATAAITSTTIDDWLLIDENSPCSLFQQLGCAANAIIACLPWIVQFWDCWVDADGHSHCDIYCF